MSPERAELATIATTLDELTKRVTALAEGLVAGGGDDAAHHLFEAERGLLGATRRLAQARRTLG